MLTLVRVERGSARPDEKTLREAVASERARLGVPARGVADLAVAGPYAIRIDGREVDEYVVWER